MHSVNGSTASPPQLVFFEPGTDQAFPLSEAARRLGLSYSTLKNYSRKGRPNLNGTIVKLEVCLLPNGATGTTLSAYHRFRRKIASMEA